MSWLAEIIHAILEHQREPRQQCSICRHVFRQSRLVEHLSRPTAYGQRMAYICKRCSPRWAGWS